MLSAFEGFLLGGGLIIAIGAQNAFLLRQGLLRQHVFILCLVAALSDAALIALGIAGMGTLVQSNKTLLFYVTIGGAIFLTLYSISAFRRAFVSSSLDPADTVGNRLAQSLATLLAFTFLNPHVYLDTVVLVGGVSGQYPGVERMYFAIGAMSASFVWFFSLGYGAIWLVPAFRNPKAWMVLDIIIGIIMALLALSLFVRAFS